MTSVSLEGKISLFFVSLQRSNLNNKHNCQHSGEDKQRKVKNQPHCHKVWQSPNIWDSGQCTLSESLRGLGDTNAASDIELVFIVGPCLSLTYLREAVIHLPLWYKSLTSLGETNVH